MAKERCIFTKETVTGNGNSIKRAPNTEKMRVMVSGRVSRFMEIMPLSVHLIMILFPRNCWRVIEGAVYFYQRNRNGKWELDKESTKYGENKFDQFGTSVAMYGNYAIVGARYYNIPGGTDQQGAVYFYQRNRNGKWELDKESTKYGENTGNDWFGQSVAIYGNYAIVGAPYYDIVPGGTGGGAAYFYQRNGKGKWELDKESTKYGENTGDYFGEECRDLWKLCHCRCIWFKCL